MLRMGRNHIAVLIKLALKGEMLFTEIRKLTQGPYHYTEGILLDLKQWGLIEERRSGRKRIFKLTEKGKEIASFYLRFASQT